MNKNKKKYAYIVVFALLCLGTLDSCQNKKNQEDGEKITKPAIVTNAEDVNNSSTETMKPSTPLPVMDFESKEFDFGKISEGKVVKHVYKFTNTGEAPLIIESARASCGCTVPDWSKDAIPVGESGSITLQFDSKGKANVQNKTVTVTANTWPKTTVLRFKAFVETSK